MEYAESIGITHIMRIRADMSCTNINRMLQIYRNIYEDNNMIFLLYFKHYPHDYPPNYLIDYAYYGKITDIKHYCSTFQDANDARFPELFNQENCFGSNDMNVIREKVVFSGKYLLDEHIEIPFLKANYSKTPLQDLYTCNTSNGLDSF